MVLREENLTAYICTLITEILEHFVTGNTTMQLFLNVLDLSQDIFIEMFRDFEICCVGALTMIHD